MKRRLYVLFTALGLTAMLLVGCGMNNTTNDNKDGMGSSVVDENNDGIVGNDQAGSADKNNKKDNKDKNDKRDRKDRRDYTERNRSADDGIFDAGSATNDVESAVDDVGRAVEDGADDIGRAAENGAEDIGDAIRGNDTHGPDRTKNKEYNENSTVTKNGTTNTTTTGDKSKKK